MPSEQEKSVRFNALSAQATAHAPNASPAVKPVTKVSPETYLSDVDTQLMLQVGGGDREAAGTLIRRNFARVSRFVMRVVRDPRVVEDLTQDVFVNVLSSAPRYTASAKFSTWLYHIATNTALNHLRNANVARKTKFDPNDAIDSAMGSSPSPERQVGLDELRERVSHAVGSLPPNQRVALILFEFESLSYEQIATVMGVTVEAVRALLTRGRASLRDLLQGYAK